MSHLYHGKYNSYNRKNKLLALHQATDVFFSQSVRHEPGRWLAGFFPPFPPSFSSFIKEENNGKCGLRSAPQQRKESTKSAASTRFCSFWREPMNGRKKNLPDPIMKFRQFRENARRKSNGTISHLIGGAACSIFSGSAWHSCKGTMVENGKK